MPYAKKSKRPRVKSTKRRQTRAPARKPASGFFTGKPTSRAVYKPPVPANQKGFLPFSNVFNVRLPYAHASGLAAPIGVASGVFTFRLNSLFDPDKSGVGIQPQQFDQISGLYGKYFVSKAKVTIEFNNPSADGLYVGYGLRFPGDTGSYIAQELQWLSMQRNVKMVPFNNSGKQVIKMSIIVPLHTLFGLPKLIYNADRVNFAATMTANPIRDATIEVLILDSTGNQANCNFRIGITYHAQLFDPKWQLIS